MVQSRTGTRRDNAIIRTALFVVLAATIPPGVALGVSDPRHQLFVVVGLVIAVIGFALGSAGRVARLVLGLAVLSTSLGVGEAVYTEPITGRVYCISLPAVALAVGTALYFVSPKAPNSSDTAEEDEGKLRLGPGRPVIVAMITFIGIAGGLSLTVAQNRIVVLFELATWLVRLGFFALLLKVLSSQGNALAFGRLALVVAAIQGIAVAAEQTVLPPEYSAINAVVPHVEVERVFAEGTRATGLFITYFTLAVYLSVLMPFLFGFCVHCWAVNGGRWAGIGHVFCLGLGLYALYATFCRTTWIGTAAGLAVQMLYLLLPSAWRGHQSGASRIRRRSRLLGLVALILVVAAVAYFASSAELRSRFDVRGDTWSSRVASFRDAMYMVQSSPVAGVGLRNYVITLFSLPRSWGYPWAEVHNSYLLLLAETGLVGFSLFAIMFGAIIYSLLRSLRVAPSHSKFLVLGSLGSVTAFLVDSVAIHILAYDPAVTLLYMIVALGVACGTRGGSPNIPDLTRRS